MVYKCSVCGYEYDEEKEGKPFSALTECPVCKQPPEKFKAVETQKSADIPSESQSPPISVNAEGMDLNYPEETRKVDSNYRYMKESLHFTYVVRCTFQRDEDCDGKRECSSRYGNVQWGRWYSPGGERSRI